MRRFLVKVVSQSYQSIRQIQTTTQRFQSVEEVKKNVSIVLSTFSYRFSKSKRKRNEMKKFKICPN